MAKSFVKIFLICLVLFTLILVPIVKVVSNVQLFEQSDGVESIQEELATLIDTDSEFFQAFGGRRQRRSYGYDHAGQLGYVR